MNQTDTIIAHCTPEGNGAIALLRLCGTDVFSIVDRMSHLSSKKKISTYKSHTIAYGSVLDQHNDEIDFVLFLIMRAPATFTGDNTVEITCHNNPFIIQNIIKTALFYGARLAHPGEFSQRAVMHNKIDLIAAEAINELIHAHTQQGLKMALAQIDGSLSAWIQSLEKKLLHTLALCQASFEFVEEDNLNFDETIRHNIAAIQKQINTLSASFNTQKIIREGIRIALIGSVNAGKSSLFNAIVGYDRAIVTNIAGTTRDSIEAGIYKNNSYWTLIDTAGLRQTNNTIEKIGIERSMHEAKKADIIILVIDGSSPLTKETVAIYRDLRNKYQTKIIPVITKSDLPQIYKSDVDAICVSVKQNSNIDLIEKKIIAKSALLLKTTSPFLLTKRQLCLIESLHVNIKSIVPLIANDIAHELVAFELTECIAHISELTGKTISEQAMDTIFKKFCVGK